jgi:hypothetical protein
MKLGSLLKPPALPAVDAGSIVAPSRFHINMLEPQAVDGNVSLYELFVINALVAQQAPLRIFEFGTFNGRTTLNLAANSPADARIFTLDLPRAHDTAHALQPLEQKYADKPSSGDMFAGRPEAAKITQLYGDSARFDFAPYLDTMDFVFVDASHAYDYVLNDSRIAIRLLRTGTGTILWHDYGRTQWWPGVTKALHELRAESPLFQSLQQIEGTSLAYLPGRRPL